MRVLFVQPRQELRPYIESFWVCESATGIALTDRSLAVPNGCSKLIIPYENSLFGISEESTGVSHEHGLYFVGNRIKATLIHSSARKTGFIGIEFSPNGAFPLFGIPMQETVADKIFDSEVLFGRWGRETRENCSSQVRAGVAAVHSGLTVAGQQHCGLLHEDLFFETSGEFFGVWEMVKPVVPALRERFASKTWCANLEEAAQRYEKWIDSRSPGHIAARREFMKQMRSQLATAA